jgi:NADPH:quinone reductase
LIPLPARCPVEVGAQFVNAITAWDLLGDAGVRPGDWLALTAGNSAVSTMVLNFAKLKKINVISIVRTVHEQLNLKEWGAAEVVDLSKLPKRLAGEIAEITHQTGANAVIDCVGGPIASELIRSLSNGGRFLIYGGFSPETFRLHSFDLLMKGAQIKPYIYRYFFHPPEANDRAVLNEIAETCGQPDFKVRVGGVHSLDDFKTAINETLQHPESGKRFLKMSDL